MTVEKLEVLKVGLGNEYYVLIIPNDEYHEFYLAHEMFESVKYMFGCRVANDEEAVELAVKNGPEHMRRYRDEIRLFGRSK